MKNTSVLLITGLVMMLILDSYLNNKQFKYQKLVEYVIMYICGMLFLALLFLERELILR